MYSCKQAARLLIEKEDRPLSFGERLALRVHVGICGDCKNFEGQLKVLHTALHHSKNQHLD
jgi:hypothetical protein